MTTQLLYGKNQAQFEGILREKHEAKALTNGSMVIDFDLEIPHSDDTKVQIIPMTAFAENADKIHGTSIGARMLIHAKITSSEYQPEGKPLRRYPRIQVHSIGVIETIKSGKPAKEVIPDFDIAF